MKSESLTGKKMKIKFKTALLIIIAVTATLITTQNLQDITLNLLFWDITLPAIAVILISLGCGFTAGYLYKSLANSKKNKINSSLKKNKIS